MIGHGWGSDVSCWADMDTTDSPCTANDSTHLIVTKQTMPDGVSPHAIAINAYRIIIIIIIDIQGEGDVRSNTMFNVHRSHNSVIAWQPLRSMATTIMSRPVHILRHSEKFAQLLNHSLPHHRTTHNNPFPFSYPFRQATKIWATVFAEMTIAQLIVSRYYPIS